MSPGLVWALVAGVWLATSLGGGAVLALLAQRIHPALEWRRLWAVYSGLLGFLTAAVMGIAWW